MTYSWPGNVRELQNVLERMVNIARTSELMLDFLPSEILEARPDEGSEPDIEPVDKVERELIMKLLGSNLPKIEIARKLGISRSTLYRKLEKYGATD
jgi:DNA-binding NtrC family response regulator